jgi:hypothetical protein
MAVDPTVDVFDQLLELVKGDSDEFLVTVTEPDLTDPDVVPLPRLPINLHESVDGTADRHIILRYASKRTPGVDDNVDALLFKDAQRGSSDIRYLAQAGDTLGQAEVLIDTADTLDTDESTVARDEDPEHAWDLEANIQDEERAGVSQIGDVTVVNGTNTVVGAATKFLLSKVGDILNLTDGTGANELKPALITKIIDDLNMEVGRTIWIDANNVTFEVRRNRRKTVASGDFRFITGVTDG